MQDIKVNFNSPNGAEIDFTSLVAGKDLYKQKCLLNLATTVNTDNIFPERGTDMLRSALNGLVIGLSDAMHLGNFAAINTLFFVKSQDYIAVDTSPDLVTDLAVTVQGLDVLQSLLEYNVQFGFADGTSSDIVIKNKQING